MSKMTVGDFEHQNRKMKKVSKGMDTVLRIVFYGVLFGLMIQERNLFSGIGWAFMISAEIIGNIPDIREMKYRSGKIVNIWYAVTFAPDVRKEILYGIMLIVNFFNLFFKQYKKSEIPTCFYIFSSVLDFVYMCSWFV